MQTRNFTFALLCFVLVVWNATPTPLAHAAQEAESSSQNWRVARRAIETLFADEMKGVANWAKSRQDIPTAIKASTWVQNRDLRRQYIFIPSEIAPSAPTDPKQVESFTRIKTARETHANRIFGLARKAAEMGDGAEAFQFLNEVLYYDPNHEQVRGILGHRKTEEGWQVASDRIRIKQATRRHASMNWAAGEYIIVNTPHFNIASTAEEEMTQFLAEKLERWHSIWCQVFFEFWSRPRNVERWINGKGKARLPSKKFDIVFFANRDQYIAQLSESVKGIEASTGYYNDSSKASFFYASEEINTWRHELTHQLFQESIRTTESPFEDQNLWLGEGIAMYFESLSDHGPYVTLGGFDSRRLQYARVRKFREGYYVPLQELASLTRKQFQQREDISRLYSQSAGLTHMLMDDINGENQSKLIEYLKLLYQGKLKPDSFQKIIGQTNAELDQAYDGFLKVTSQQVEEFSSLLPRRTELALPAAKLSDDAFTAIGRCRELKWLDLTANRVTGDQIDKLKDCQKLQKIFLTNCAIDLLTAEALGQFPNLEELDLSGSSISDTMIPNLRGARSLAILRLTKTGITDTSLRYFASFEGLQFLDLTDTKVTAAGVQQLRSAKPGLQIAH